MAETRVYNVKGMSCDHCKQAVTKAVEAVAGVQNVAVDLTTGKVTVTFSQAAEDEKIREAVEDAGYEVD